MFVSNPVRDKVTCDMRLWSNRCDRGKDSSKHFEGFRAFPHADGTKRWFFPRALRNVALLQSKMESLMKIWKSCSKVISRTLRSGKNWLRYSSFSVISLVKWPNLWAWPTLGLSNPHWQNTTKCLKKIETRNGMTCRECASQKCFVHIFCFFVCLFVCWNKPLYIILLLLLEDYRKDSIFSDNAGKIPSISPFYPSKYPVRESTLPTLVLIFGRPPYCPHNP